MALNLDRIFPKSLFFPNSWIFSKSHVVMVYLLRLFKKIISISKNNWKMLLIKKIMNFVPILVILALLPNFQVTSDNFQEKYLPIKIQSQLLILPIKLLKTRKVNIGWHCYKFPSNNVHRNLTMYCKSTVFSSYSENVL